MFRKSKQKPKFRPKSNKGEVFFPLAKGSQLKINFFENEWQRLKYIKPLTIPKWWNTNFESDFMERLYAFWDLNVKEFSILNTQLLEHVILAHAVTLEALIFEDKVLLLNALKRRYLDVEKNNIQANNKKDIEENKPKMSWCLSEMLPHLRTSISAPMPCI